MRPDVLLLALLLVPLLPAGAQDRATPCDGFEDHPGQGPSRQRADGLWEVCLRDGAIVLSHGPDPASAELAAGNGKPGGTPSRAPPCAADPAVQYHGHAIYAVAHDRTDRYASYESTVRGYIHNANGKLYEEAQELGHEVEYRFLCDAGDVVVSRAVLPTDHASATFSSIVSDLRALGFRSASAQYWVWYDGGVGGYCGQGTISSDDRLSLRNFNNRGNRFGLTYGCSWTTMMHENGHNIGAVQLSAPNTSGGWHCNDEQDIMCYNDGGSSSGTFRACSDEHFDCGHDDYFHPRPPIGNFLHDHWNLGSPLNRFNTHSDVPAVPSAVQDLEVDDGEILLGIAPSSRKVLSWSDPATGAPVTDFVIYRTDPGGSESLRARIDGDRHAFTDTGVSASGTYTYRVTALNAAGEGASASVAAHHTQI